MTNFGNGQLIVGTYTDINNREVYTYTLYSDDGEGDYIFNSGLEYSLQSMKEGVIKSIDALIEYHADNNGIE